MRAEAPIAHVPQLGATLMTRRDDIFIDEKKIDLFSSEQPGGLMTVRMGQNRMRKDGDAHKAERAAIFPTVSPRTVHDTWRARFETFTAAILDEIRPQGRADVLRAFDERIPALRQSPDASLLSVQMQAGLSDAQTRANAKLAISGGQNEPRDVIAGMTWAMLTHPDQLTQVQSGAASWLQAFGEYSRWIAPIGMSPRRVAHPCTHGGVSFSSGDRVFLMFSSGNRDEAVFARPDVFDLTQDAGPAISFAAGPHFCAITWAARCLVADVALPMIFDHLPGLRLAGEVPFGGWAFRGPLRVPVASDA